MDKEFMMQRILVRMAELEQWYKNAVNNKDRNGNPCTPGAAKEIRTHTKRDMRIPDDAAISSFPASPPFPARNTKICTFWMAFSLETLWAPTLVPGASKRTESSTSPSAP